MAKKRMAKQIFFAESLASARAYLRGISRLEGISWHTPKLAKKQYKHIRGWKTWTFARGRK